MSVIPSEIDEIKVTLLSKPMRSHTSELIKYLRDIDIEWVAYKHGYSIAEIAEIFGYKKAWLYQLIKLGKRFSDDVLDTYKMGVLNETNVLPVEIADKRGRLLLSPSPFVTSPKLFICFQQHLSQDL